MPTPVPLMAILSRCICPSPPSLGPPCTQHHYWSSVQRGAVRGDSPCGSVWWKPMGESLPAPSGPQRCDGCKTVLRRVTPSLGWEWIERSDSDRVTYGNSPMVRDICARSATFWHYLGWPDDARCAHPMCTLLIKKYRTMGL